MKADAVTKLALAAILAASVALSGCSVGQIRDAALVGAHGKLLDAEFEAAAIAVTDSTVLTVDEREALWRAVDELDDQRLYLRKILERPATEQAVAAVTACARLEKIGRTYSAGRTTFVAALDREGEPVPLMLRQYDESAAVAYDGLHAQVCDDGSAIQAADVAGYLGLTLRVIAAVNGAPV